MSKHGQVMGPQTIAQGGCPFGKATKDHSKAIQFMKKEVLKANYSKTKDADIIKLKKLAKDFGLPVEVIFGKERIC